MAGAVRAARVADGGCAEGGALNRDCEAGEVGLVVAVVVDDPLVVTVAHPLLTNTPPAVNGFAGRIGIAVQLQVVAAGSPFG